MITEIDIDTKKKSSPVTIAYTIDDLCNMPLHNIAQDAEHRAEIMKVPGGWIYMFSTGITAFVPDPTRNTDK